MRIVALGVIHRLYTARRMPIP